ncbi:hypothetical protein ACOME3_005188 [Neoechinorhynchus agilis]
MKTPTILFGENDITKISRIIAQGTVNKEVKQELIEVCRELNLADFRLDLLNDGERSETSERNETIYKHSNAPESLGKLDPDDPERSISALEPNLRNIHEVSSPSQDGVFLDFLSLPYSTAESWNIFKRQKICQYFKEIETNEKGQ